MSLQVTQAIGQRLPQPWPRTRTPWSPRVCIIGDSAYPLLPQLMKPYRDNGHLTARQRRFNQRLHSARVVIEHAFGLLKGKFRRLNYLYMARVEDISRAVTACCILHNICIEPADRLNAEDAAVFDAVEHVEPHENPQAAAYRDDLCNSL
ncbi:hypothetical protein ACEWY4_007590 [Coilia grayii]|uniref:DDE Tnp4 domain-containing protein n=1 Tax=Coilia grayii TaxID=363190 RepID=A0ABD1KGV2_9TELE